MKNLKEKLDFFVSKYETPDFIKSDPVQFLHCYQKEQDIEVAGLIASAFAYGKREVFIEKLRFVFEVLGNSPHEFCLNFDKDSAKIYFKHFKYRFNTGDDLVLLFEKLYCFYNQYESMDKFLIENICSSKEKAKQAVGLISEKLTENIDLKSYCYLFPSPRAGSACKRMNLFLKWMVRKSIVDIGCWKSLEPKDLIIPLDVHVARVSRELNLTSRKSNDWQTAEEITSKLRELDRSDPIKYDFALFDIGVDKIAFSAV